MGTFVPHVIVRNLLGSAQSVTVSIEYPDPGTGFRPALLHLAPIPLEAYATKDMSLDAAFGLLPLPLPFCSIRVRYSGPAGSLIVQVSNVDDRRDLVIDSRLANEGDGWAGSGAHPWHLDNETESILFLTDMGDKPVRIGFQVQANRVHYYLTNLKLDPHDTRAIDLRKLRDAQEADFKKNRIPAAATDGSVSWGRIDNVPVMGRLVVIQRHKGIASNYDCGTCSCPITLKFISVDPASINLIPASTMDCTCKATYENCNGYPFVYDETTNSNTTWSTANTAIAYMDSSVKGRVHGVAGGSTTVAASYTGVTLYTINKFGQCVAQNGTKNGSSACLVYTPIQHNYPRNPLPSPCWISSFFDAIRNGHAHRAEDVVYDNGKGTGGVTPSYGTPVYTMEAGRVLAINSNAGPAPGGYPACIGANAPGNYVKIQAVASNICTGSSGDNYSTIYFHVKPTVTVGQCVTAGQQIGTIDNSGCQSGAHTHVGRKDPNGNPVNFTIPCTNSLPTKQFYDGLVDDSVPDNL